MVTDATDTASVDEVPTDDATPLSPTEIAALRSALRGGPLALPRDPALTRERIGSEVREIHFSHYGRMSAVADEVRASLDQSLVPSIDELDPVPHATIEQAKRRARLRTSLLASGAHTHESLADGRGQSLAAARQWVHRARQRGSIFTVKHDGETLVPAFLLDEDLQARPEYAGAIAALTAVGSEGWGLWAWFALPSAWLGGKVPAAHALVDEAAVTRAAERDASNAE